MAGMKRILILGDRAAAHWHPITGIDEELVRILSGYEAAVTEDYKGMKYEDLRGYDAVVNYVDAWDAAGAGFAGALIAYAAAGGAVLTIHSGVIARNLPEIPQLVGAAFTGHPEHETLEYVPVGEHPLAKGGFAIDEEPYQFELSNLAKRDVFMEYLYKGGRYPAAWTRSFGAGKLCYLSMGHNLASFQSEGFGALIRAAAAWCVG